MRSRHDREVAGSLVSVVAAFFETLINPPPPDPQKQRMPPAQRWSGFAAIVIFPAILLGLVFGMVAVIFLRAAGMNALLFTTLAGVALGLLGGLTHVIRCLVTDRDP